MQYIVATHGYLADGYKSAVKVLCGKDIWAINAYVEQQQEIEEAFAALTQQWSPEERLVVFTDLPGGSVTQAVTSLLGCYNITLITGVNLALVMVILFRGETLSEDDVQECIELAKTQLISVNQLLSAK